MKAGEDRLDRERLDLAEKRFGERIRALRTRQGWTLRVLGEKTDMHPTFIGQVERGEKGIRLHGALRLCEALGVDAGDVFRGILPVKKVESPERPK